MHYTRQISSSGKLLDGHERRIKATLAVAVPFPELYACMCRFQRSLGANALYRSDRHFLYDEAYRAFRRASQLSETSINAMLAIDYPNIVTVNVKSALSAIHVHHGQLPLLKKCPTFPI